MSSVNIMQLTYVWQWRSLALSCDLTELFLTEAQSFWQVSKCQKERPKVNPLLSFLAAAFVFFFYNYRLLEEDSWYDFSNHSILILQ